MKYLDYLLLTTTLLLSSCFSHYLLAQENQVHRFEEIDFMFEPDASEVIYDYMNMPIGIQFNYVLPLKYTDVIIQDFNCAQEFQLQYQVGALFCELADLAKTSGVNLQVISSYRSIELQEVILKKYGHHRAEAPGYSEHHLGTVVDIKGMTKDSKSFLWMLDHAFEAGWVPTYYFREENLIQKEPWHWRYVGNEASLKFLEYWENEIMMEKSRLLEVYK